MSAFGDALPPSASAECRSARRRSVMHTSQPSPFHSRHRRRAPTAGDRDRRSGHNALSRRPGSYSAAPRRSCGKRKSLIGTRERLVIISQRPRPRSPDSPRDRPAAVCRRQPSPAGVRSAPERLQRDRTQCRWRCALSSIDVPSGGRLLAHQLHSRASMSPPQYSLVHLRHCTPPVPTCAASEFLLWHLVSIKTPWLPQSQRTRIGGADP